MKIFLTLHCLQNVIQTSFENAVKEEKWRKAMDDEIDVIERNGTGELSDLPNRHKNIGVKWVYKTKLKENGEIDKHKARLVAKGYNQENGVDYTKVFSPVGRHDTIKIIISFAAKIRGLSSSWMSNQLFYMDIWRKRYLSNNLLAILKLEMSIRCTS